MYLARGDDVPEEKSAGQRREPRRNRRGVLLEGSRRVVGFRLVEEKAESAPEALASQLLQAPNTPRPAHRSIQRINIHPQQPEATCLAPYTNFAQLSRAPCI